MATIFQKKTRVSENEKVSDYDFKAHYPNVNMNTSWAAIEPYIRQATRQYVIPFIGETLYDDLLDKIHTNETLTASQKKLIEMLRDSIAHYTIMEALPKMKTVIANMGAGENTPNDGATQPSMWGFKTTLYAVVQSADKYLDIALAWMEANTSNDSNYLKTLWKDTPAYNAGASPWFQTTGEFSDVWDIQGSRRTFLAMVPILRRVESEVRAVLGDDFAEVIVGKKKNGTLNTLEKKLVKYVCGFMAPKAVNEAVAQFPMIVDTGGFRPISNVDAVDQRAYASEPMRIATAGLKEASDKVYRTAFADLVGLLEKEAANLDGYTAQTPSIGNDVLCSGYGAVFI